MSFTKYKLLSIITLTFLIRQCSFGQQIAMRNTVFGAVDNNSIFLLRSQNTEDEYNEYDILAFNAKKESCSIIATNVDVEKVYIKKPYLYYSKGAVLTQVNYQTSQKDTVIVAPCERNIIGWDMLDNGNCIIISEANEDSVMSYTLYGKNGSPISSGSLAYNIMESEAYRPHIEHYGDLFIIQLQYNLYIMKPHGEIKKIASDCWDFTLTDHSILFYSKNEHILLNEYDLTKRHFILKDYYCSILNKSYILLFTSSLCNNTTVPICIVGSEIYSWTGTSWTQEDKAIVFKNKKWEIAYTNGDDLVITMSSHIRKTCQSLFQ